MQREWLTDRLLDRMARGKELAIILAVLGLATLAASGQIPVRPEYLLLGGLGSLAALLALWRTELGLAMMLGSFLVGFSLLSVGTLNLGVTFGLGLVLFGVWVLRGLQGKSLRLAAPGLTPLLLWILLGGLSVLYSYMAWDVRVPGTGRDWSEGHRWSGYQLAGLGGLAFTTAVYILSVNGIRARRWLVVVWAAAMGVLLVVIAPPVLAYLQHPYIPWRFANYQAYRSSTAGVPEMYLAVLALGLLSFDRHPWRWVAWVALFAFASIGVFAAYYLSTYLGLAGGILVIVWQRSRRLLALVLVGVGLVGLTLFPEVWQIINQRVVSGDLFRLVIWDTALNIWLTSPILGVGPGNLPSYMLALNPLPYNWVLQGLFYAHNVYLNILAENGVMGLICVLWFIGSYIRGLWGKPRAEDGLLGGIMAGGLGLMIASVIVAFVGSGLFAVSSSGLFAISGIAFVWVLVGGAVAARQLNSEEKRTRD